MMKVYWLYLGRIKFFSLNFVVFDCYEVFNFFIKFLFEIKICLYDLKLILGNVDVG